jgi:PAS domain S-box-containing protein
MAADGRILFANCAFAEIVGRERGALAGTRFQDLLSRGGAIFYETQFAFSLMLRGRLDEISLEFVRESGGRVPVFVNAVFFKQDRSQPARILIAAFAAPQRHLYEAELLRARKESEQMADVVRRSSDAIIRLSAEGQIGSWNDGAQQIFGYKPDEVLGNQLNFLFNEDMFADLEGSLSDLQRGLEVTKEAVARRKNGTPVDVSISMTPHMEAPGMLAAFSAIIRDVSRRKQAETALLQTEKLASVGRLASSIAHEINNPLASVTNLLYILKSRVADDETRKLVDTAEQELARVSQIATHTLRFHKQSTGKTRVDLRALVDSVLGLYRARLQNSGVDVVNDSSDCTPLLCYENDLRQVLLNLVSNAFDAMRSGGRLTIRCRHLAGAPGEGWVRITVSDTGIGMDRTTLDRIFEPFFSTKGIGGTGLGLWISKDLIARNGGSVRVKSCQEPDRNGTTFVMWFPDASGGEQL